MKYVIIDFSGEYDFLSNFYEIPVTFRKSKSGEDLVFPSNEHAFQACKYKAMDASLDEKWAYVEKVRTCATPGLAKKAGRSVRIDTEKWDSIKISVMREVVLEKFLQNEDIKKRLLDTDAALLVEGNTWGDTFWGRSGGKGYNLLGSILMEVRGFLYWTEVNDEAWRKRWSKNEDS